MAGIQKYVLIQLLETIDEGTEFPASSWPLHVTLASNFVIDWDETGLFDKLSALLADHKPFLALAGDDDFFGPQRQVHVTTLDMNDELRSLHNDVIAALKAAGAAFDEPQYLEAGFRAHATVQSDIRLNKGDPVAFDALAIVDMFPHGDISRRKLLRTIKLGTYQG